MRGRALVWALLIVAYAAAGTAAVAVWLARNEQALENAPANPFQPAPDSLRQGQAVYAQHCQDCHGLTGLGDGPLARTLSRTPANLQAHAGNSMHSDTQLFGWITGGMPASPMPAFGGVLSASERWHVLNYVRSLAACGPTP
jgi:putative copper resistance protein D